MQSTSPNIGVDLDGPDGLPLRWARFKIADSPGAPVSCERIEADGAQTFGVPWLITLTNTDTGQLLSARGFCEWPGVPPPPPPPPPPTRTDIEIDQDQVFALETGLNPPVRKRGVSQLPTWFWCSNDGAVDVDATLPPYRAAAVVEVVELTWTVEGPDGQAELVATDCGSEPPIDSDGASAAATWTPNLPGESTITLTTTWSGTWTYTYLDPIFGAIDLGTFDLGAISVTSAPVVYDVYEIQTVGRGSRSYVEP
ncbi:MAG: hypothetical protein QNJ12_06210 [Ilumatobacter sp.]|uniref:hypothetical protein n=1 Tax=Ilumatobacter sp. TaxID=1967498 RepID=UPI0026190D5E|nr:hypothetical protein [Ilumatobacter sp.]MDJ0768366.1 hypothetical protein [Ilumatobacter sp.]